MLVDVDTETDFQLIKHNIAKRLNLLDDGDGAHIHLFNFDGAEIEAQHLLRESDVVVVAHGQQLADFLPPRVLVMQGMEVIKSRKPVVEVTLPVIKVKALVDASL